MVTMSSPRPSTLPTGFGEATRSWFDAVFEQPTPAQTAAWQAIGSGEHSLVIAPTGSGKTLAAFLHCLDRLVREPGKGKVRVLYVSPLKALAVDVERNLRAPLRGIQLASERLGLPTPEVRVAVRSGDTPASERRRMLTHPPDVLITTPESLFLMLASQVGQTLDGVETIIVDEVHALAGTKRGAHLAVSLERLAAMSAEGHDPQRIGLSATVSPAERVADFLGGDRPVTIVRPPSTKSWHLDVEVPLDDMTDLSRPPVAAGATETDGPERPPSNSIWPFLEQRILELVDDHRSTICFVNSRRVAERLTSHLNDLHTARLDPEARTAPSNSPAQVMAQSGASSGNDGHRVPVIARAHHGSVSKDRRLEIETELKSGRLACVVATSSLELGIDMGSVDLVIQVGSPPSVANGLQRIGRAGHQVGAVSEGVLLPTHRGDLLESAVVATRMNSGDIEPVAALRNPLDVLAQHLVAMGIDTNLPVEDAWHLLRRSDPFRALPRSAFEGVLDMLSGRYPSEEFAELRPRLVWDRVAGTITARPGARRLVTTSGGTIADRGLFGVYLVGEGTAGGRHEPGRRVGELDEEMVYESRVGDVFTLGTTSWRIQEITPNQVLVLPAPGQPGRLPFWRGDSPGRPAALGRAMGELTGRLTGSPDDADLVQAGLDDRARENLSAYLREQIQATGVLPDAHTIVVERFRDELGDWRVCVHSAAGQAVLQPWALVIEARARERYGVEAQASAGNDGIVLRIPDIESGPPGIDLVLVDPDDLEALVTDQVFGSALFAARFRECAGRALLLPKRDPGRRSPLWQQRMRAAQLLSVASGHADFPIILETMRECLEDVFDLPSLTSLLQDISSRRTRLVEVDTPEASPFAKSLLFGYVGEFIYDGDQPLAERKLAALSLDPALLAELLGREGSQILFDEGVVATLEAELQHLATSWRATSAEGLWDILRTIGPLTPEECRERSDGAADDWVDELTRSGRIAACRLGGGPMLAVADDFALLRDGLGIPTPAGVAVPEATTPPAEAIGHLARRSLAAHVGTSSGRLADRLGLPEVEIARALEAAVARGEAVLTELPGPQSEPQYIRQQVVGVLRRRTLALLRAGVEAVEPAQFARFLTSWQEVDSPGRGTDALLGAVDVLAGCRIPASMLESVVLPARVRDYQPGMLDEVLSAGEVVWTGAGAIGRQDGWVQLWPSDAILATPSVEPLSEPATSLDERLESGGAWRLGDLLMDQTTMAEATDALWELVWAGRVTSDSFVAVRSLATRGALKQKVRVRPTRRSAMRQIRIPTALDPHAGPVGRWSRVPVTHDDPTSRRLTAMALQLGRHGVLTRGSVLTESLSTNFSEAYRVLMALEEAGSARRGYFVEGLGAAQFALPGAVDRLRETPSTSGPLLLAACDPANPWGAALPWPEGHGHRPTRKAGALVVLIDGRPVLYLERGTRTAVTFGDDPALLECAFQTVADAVGRGVLTTVTIDRIDQVPALQDRAKGALLTQAGFTMSPQGYRLRSTAVSSS